MTGTYYCWLKVRGTKFTVKKVNSIKSPKIIFQKINRSLIPWSVSHRPERNSRYFHIMFNRSEFIFLIYIPVGETPTWAENGNKT